MRKLFFAVAFASCVSLLLLIRQANEPMTAILAPPPLSATSRDLLRQVRIEASTVQPTAASRNNNATPPNSLNAPERRRSVSQRIGGRDGADHSHMGMQADAEGIFAAWAPDDSRRCHGMSPRNECIDDEAVEWFRRHVLLGIVSGKEGAFRVEVSQCSWLGHFPPENVFCFSDVVSSQPRTPHSWVAGVLPRGVEERDGDVFSPFITKGYVREVRRAGQGYSAGWVVAQFRFPQAVDHLLREAEQRGNGTVQWVMVIDDDTIVNLNHLVKRLKGLDASKPWYLSRRGWGGAGHLYSHEAMRRMRRALPECVDKWMVRQFRASDTMLLKCAEHAKLTRQLEHTMSHCPASRAGVEKMLSADQVTFHGKKDFYPPVVLTTFRVGLYYLASYCKDRTAAELAVFYSSCAFGNCKAPGCTKEKDQHRARVWLDFSRNNTIEMINWGALQTVPRS